LSISYHYSTYFSSILSISYHYSTSGCACAHPFNGHVTSHPVVMSVMCNDTFCTTIVRKKRGNRLRMRTRLFS
jgi:hypothetical protein